MNHHVNKTTKVLATLGVAGTLIVSLSGCFQNLVQNPPVTCTIVDKDRSTESGKNGSKSVFRIYTEGSGCDGTYGLADNILQGNFNASDMYGQLQKGQTYRLETVGVRNGFFSSFKEIVRFQKVEAAK